MEQKKSAVNPHPGRGGKRPGAGRPRRVVGDGPAKPRTIWCTETEYDFVRATLADFRDNPSAYGFTNTY